MLHRRLGIILEHFLRQPAGQLPQQGWMCHTWPSPSHISSFASTSISTNDKPSQGRTGSQDRSTSDHQNAAESTSSHPSNSTSSTSTTKDSFPRKPRKPRVPMSKSEFLSPKISDMDTHLMREHRGQAGLHAEAGRHTDLVHVLRRYNYSLPALRGQASSSHTYTQASACAHTLTHIHIIHTHTYTHTHTYNTYTRTRTQMYTYAHVYTYEYTHTHIGYNSRKHAFVCLCFTCFEIFAPNYSSTFKP